MMSSSFKTTTHGKWILAGEHAVIRNHGALVFPIKEKKLSLEFNESGTELSLNFEGETSADTNLLFWSVLEQGMQLLGKSPKTLSGHFNLSTNIPVGVGLGASAALCVAMARWFASRDFAQNLDVAEFAKQLEHLFHGKSSGLDIAGVASSSGIYFKNGVSEPLKSAWQPLWSLSSCRQIGITSHCITKVQSLWQNDPTHAALIDQQMDQAVILARKSLEEYTENSENMLSTAINNAAACFQQWGLVSMSLNQHMQKLRDKGAVAVKPTGSGGGGFVISLWKSMPKDMDIELIAI